MAFVDNIPYVQGGSGSITDADGQTVNYTFSGNATEADWDNTSYDPNGIVHDDAARVFANENSNFAINFDSHVNGVSIRMSSVDDDEPYFFSVDGVEVDMFALVSSGMVTIENLGSNSSVSANPDGSVSGEDDFTDGAFAVIKFNFPVQSVGVTRGTGGTTSNSDYFEVGIESETFDVVCFTDGTWIETAQGPVKVENLDVGTLVKTTDGNLMPIRWIGKKRVDFTKDSQMDRLRPITITQHALGAGLPKETLNVSRQHNMLAASNIVERMFDQKEILVPAHKLTQLPGVYLNKDITSTTYYHIMLDDHQLLIANGTAAESFYPGDRALNALSPQAMAEIKAIFPNIETEIWDKVRFQPKLSQVDGLLRRHRHNNKAIVA